MNETTDASAIFAPIWKRKWLILAVGILAGFATYFYYHRESPTYGSSTGIYLGSGSELQSLLGEGNANSAGAERSIANQVVLINSNVVGEVVRRKLVKEGNSAAGSGSAAASGSAGTDLIAISTTAGSGQAAADLANAYAKTYLRLRDAGYQANVNVALVSTRKQLKTTLGSKSSDSTQALQVQNLVDRINYLRSQLSLGDAGDRQIDPAAASTVPLSPKPTRNAIFGFVLGTVLASLAAYGVSRFDRRLRSLADIETAFQVPVIAAIPSIRRPISLTNGQAIPAAALREPLRRLHTTLQLRSISDNIENRATPRSVLAISADAGDGKSTMIAGLALVQAEAAERVAIVESDLRRPVQAQLLGVDGSHGLAEVLAGALTVQEAIQVVGMVPSEEPPSTYERAVGSVGVMPSGGTVANPPALLAGRAMPMLLQSVSESFDYVLVDAPPPLEVSDVLPLLAMVDAIVVVARVGHTGETSARRLVDLLTRAQHAPIVGIVATDASTADIEAFGLATMDYAEPRLAPRRA